MQDSLVFWGGLPRLGVNMFGSNVYGEPKYRIIFAPSRRITVVDRGRPRSIMAYRKLGAVWVLESWNDPWQYCQMLPSQWNNKLAAILGPYPERGEYDVSHVFSPVLPDDCNIEKLISWIEAGKTKSFQDNLDACKAEYDQETKDRQREVEGRIHSAYPAFGGTAIASSRVARGTKNPRIIRTAEEVGLPIGHNKFMQLRRPNGNNPNTAPNHR